MLVLERLHVALDPRQVLGELRFALAPMRRGLLDDAGGSPSRVAISSARLLPGEP